MIGLEAPWVGKSKEEYNNEREYEFPFTMCGTVIIYAQNYEDALDRLREMSELELLDYVEETII